MHDAFAREPYDSCVEIYMYGCTKMKTLFQPQEEEDEREKSKN